MSSADRVDSALASLRVLHDEVDAEAKRLASVHAARMQCRRGCSDCCIDDLRVTRIEAERIRAAHPDLLASGVPHPPGACAFLDEVGACRVYAERPQVCRSQGLPLRILFENEEGDIEERRDICPLNVEGGPVLDELAEDACWLVGPREIEIGRLDASVGGSDATRVALRDLFAFSGGSDPHDD